jgi:Cu2+-exporting ATPase
MAGVPPGVTGVASALPACFHCGLPVVGAGPFRALVLGAEREFCCAGCGAVARTIVAAGFERYYETRRAPGPEGDSDRAMRDLPLADIYDDPVAQRQFVAVSGENQREATLILDRIRCVACLWLNEQYLRRLPGVLRVDINYATHRAQVAWDATRVPLSAILEAIRAIGYDAYPYDPRQQDERARRDRRRALWRLFIAGFGAMQVMMYALPVYIDDGAGTLSREAEQLMRWASLALTAPVVVLSGAPFFSAAWADLRHWRISLDTPIAIGLAAGFGASAWATFSGEGEVYFDSVAMLLFLLLGARYVEMSARQRASRELDHLARWMPSFAWRLRDAGDAASAARLAAHLLAPGDHVLVPAGECVPADGVVVSGDSSCDESLLTGESRPVAKRAGAELTGGAVNLEQPLVMRVSRARVDTKAAAILRLVERAAAGRPRLVEGADRMARVLTWLVLAVAGIAFAGWAQVAPDRALWVAVAVLVATCPCALALAAPIVLTRANAQLLALGIALTRSRAVEALERASDVVLDKTGTLTSGRFSLARTIPLASLATDRCLALARAIEATSRHPIARAFAGEGARPSVAAVRNFPGHGVEAIIEGRRVRIGTESFCRELTGRPPPARFARPAAFYTPVLLADERGWLAAFLLEDELRADAGEFIASLKAHGLRVHLCSGDTPAVVEAVARRLGIESFAGSATPQDKFAFVAGLQRERRVVVMVGDGLNDAPVLALADVSVAMGSGADAAQAQADLVLLGSRLRAITRALAIARGAMRVIRQNFGWALVYNAAALPLAAIGWIGPWEAALGMAASSFVVLLNALRPLVPGPQEERGAVAAKLAPV